MRATRPSPAISSIRRHLLVWVLGALALGALLQVIVSYVVTLDEMNEIFQDNLKQVALAVYSHREADEVGEGMVTPRLPSAYDNDGEHFDFVTMVWSAQGELLFSSSPATVFPFDPKPGWSRVQEGGEAWYVYTLAQPDVVVLAAQRVVARGALAAESTSKMLLPLVVLVVLIGLLLLVALRRGLEPLGSAARELATRSETSLSPIAVEGFPKEIHPLVSSLNGLMQRLSVAFAAQRTFVADAAHELRTPITALRLQLQLLERAPDERARDLAIVELRAGMERMQHLVEQLLKLSRLEPDGVQTAAGSVDLAELVREVVGSLSAKADQKRIDLGAKAAADVPVSGDRHQLETLLVNLVDNALRYVPAGGVVDVEAGVRGRQAFLSVTDNGPGIPVAERERVFDRFYRGESAPVTDTYGVAGSGLGLSIVRSVAERHGARVDLDSGLGGAGLGVRVSFPASADTSTGR